MQHKCANPRGKSALHAANHGRLPDVLENRFSPKLSIFHLPGAAGKGPWRNPLCRSCEDLLAMAVGRTRFLQVPAVGKRSGIVAAGA
jgi:hypothetical protein